MGRLLGLVFVFGIIAVIYFIIDKVSESRVNKANARIKELELELAIEKEKNKTKTNQENFKN